MRYFVQFEDYVGCEPEKGSHSWLRDDAQDPADGDECECGAVTWGEWKEPDEPEDRTYEVLSSRSCLVDD